MPSAVTIDRPDVIALIEAAAERFTNGNTTEAVALALRRLEGMGQRTGFLFGAHRGSVTFVENVDPTEPVLGDAMDAELGHLV